MAYRAGSLPIGAVITDAAGAIVGRGRNRIFEAARTNDDAGAAERCLFGHRLAHAEMNVLLDVVDGAVGLQGCTLYTTLEPCALCIGAIRMVRVQQVHYAARDPAAGSLALRGATDFMRRGAIHVQRLAAPELEAVLVAMQVEALLRIDARTQQQPWFRHWESALGTGVALGRELFASGVLQRLAACPETTMAHVLETLAAQVEGAGANGAHDAPPPVDPLDGATTSRPLVLLVTGAPASGKSSLAPPLAARLGLPLLSKDLYKESLFESLGWSDRDWSPRLGAASMQLLYRSAEAVLRAGQSVALECNFYARWDTPKLHALAERFGCTFIQVLCTAPGPVLVERFRERVASGARHPGHDDATSLEQMLQRLLDERWAALELAGPVFVVNTSAGPIDIDGLAAAIEAARCTQRVEV